MRYVVNGRVPAGITNMWRIDDTRSELTGLDLLQNPVCLVIKLSDAERICNLLNREEAALAVQTNSAD